MGKGDKKSKRGKIVIGSFGVRRAKRRKTNPALATKTEPKPKKSAEKPVVAPVAEITEEQAIKKAAPKKTTKKTAEGTESVEKPKASKAKKSVGETAEPPAAEEIPQA